MSTTIELDMAISIRPHRQRLGGIGIMPAGSSKAARDEWNRTMLLLGEMTAAWGEIDAIFVQIVATVAETDTKNADIIYYSLNNFGSRFDIVRNLIHHRINEGKEKSLMIRLLGKIRALADARNTYIHSDYILTWSGSKPGRIQRSTIRPRRDVPEISSRVTPAELEKHVTDVAKIATVLNSLVTGWTLRPSEVAIYLQGVF